MSIIPESVVQTTSSVSSDASTKVSGTINEYALDKVPSVQTAVLPTPPDIRGVSEYRCAREILKLLLADSRQTIAPMLAALKAGISSCVIAIEAQKLVYQAQYWSLKLVNEQEKIKSIALAEITSKGDSIFSFVPPDVDRLFSGCPDLNYLKVAAQAITANGASVARGIVFNLNNKLSLEAEVSNNIIQLNYINDYFKAIVQDIDYVLSLDV